MNKIDKLSILLSYYNDRSAICKTLENIEKLYGGSVGKIYIVDDGSFVEPVDLDWLPPVSADYEILMLNRNLGNQPALAIALNFVGRQNITETLVVMDCDGEDRPEEIALLLAAKAPGVDVVVAQRSKRSEGWRFRYFYKAYQLLFRLGTGLTIDFGNFAAFEPAALRVLDKYPELSKHLPAAILLAKLNIIKVPTERGVRLGGRSHHTLTTHLLHGLNALGVFSERVLARAIVLSFVLCGCLTVATAIGIAMKSWGTASPGWLTTVVGISLASGLQLSILVAVVFLLSNRSLSDALHSKQDFAHLIDGVQKRKGTGGNE